MLLPAVVGSDSVLSPDARNDDADSDLSDVFGNSVRPHAPSLSQEWDPSVP